MNIGAPPKKRSRVWNFLKHKLRSARRLNVRTPFAGGAYVGATGGLWVFSRGSPLLALLDGGEELAAARSRWAADVYQKTRQSRCFVREESVTPKILASCTTCALSQWSCSVLQGTYKIKKTCCHPTVFKYYKFKSTLINTKRTFRTYISISEAQFLVQNCALLLIFEKKGLKIAILFTY